MDWIIGFLAVINVFVGISAGLWFIYSAISIHDYIQKINYCVLGLVDLYFGIVYYITIMNGNHSAISNGLSALLRPGNTLLLLIPLLIALRSNRI